MGIKLLKKGSGLFRSLLIKSHILIFTFALLAILFTNEVSAEIIVQDFRGKTLRLKKPAERVVCLIESALTGIYMLGAGNKIVGIPINVYQEGFYYSETFKYYSILDERIKKREIPALGNWESVNVEKVLSLKPDLVIIWANQIDAIDVFEKLGIPVYGVFIKKIDDIFKEINDFGVIFDAKKRAEELIRYIKEEIKNIEEIARKIKVRKKVFFSWSQHSFLQTSCKGSIVDEIINRVGVINVCGNIEAESHTLTMERIVKLDPDLIIMWHTKSLTSEDIMKNNQYRIIRAVKSGLVYQFGDTFFFDLWTLKFIISMKFIAKASYPEFYRFEIEKDKIRIINFLYGKKLL